MLKNLNVYDWNQFEEINIDFDETITIITGVNGSGKSSIIRLLSKLIGWDHTEIMNKFNKKLLNDNNITHNFNLDDILHKKLSEVITDNNLDDIIRKKLSQVITENNATNSNNINDSIRKAIFQGINNKRNVSSDEESEDVKVKGKIETMENIYQLSIEEEQSTIDDELLYEMTIQPVDWDYNDEYIDEYTGVEVFEKGINVPAHRMPYFYNPTEYISARKLKKSEFYNHYKYELIRRQVTGYHYDSDDQPQQYIKSSLITLAMYSGNNNNIQDSKNNNNDFKEFIEVLQKILPKTLKFENLIIIDGEVVLQTGTGNFLIDAVSGGIGALIDLAWQIFMAKPENNNESFFVLIDEIENHLHPSMQRSILPDLVNAFPHVQFIVTTHSPFVINSIENAKVIALKYNEDDRVVCDELDLTKEYSSAMEVLREILDVPVLMPIWLENKIEKILEKHKTNLDTDTYKLLKYDLEQQGLENFMPYTLERLSRVVKND